MGWRALIQSLLKSIGDKRCTSGAAVSPSEDVFGKYVDKEGSKHEALPSGHNGKIGDPETIGARYAKTPRFPSEQ
jgi:hypothetical protein